MVSAKPNYHYDCQQDYRGKSITMRASASAALPYAVLMSTLFVSVAAFRAPLKCGHRSAAAIVRLGRNKYVGAAPFLMERHAIGYLMSKRHSKLPATRLLSTSADINLPKSTQTVAANALHTVMVHRNKQSLAFREGTPLVFTKSIAATYSELLDGSSGQFDGKCSAL